jgi:hypothetical protein
LTTTMFGRQSRAQPLTETVAGSPRARAITPATSRPGARQRAVAGNCRRLCDAVQTLELGRRLRRLPPPLPPHSTTAAVRLLGAIPSGTLSTRAVVTLVVRLWKIVVQTTRPAASQPPPQPPPPLSQPKQQPPQSTGALVGLCSTSKMFFTIKKGEGFFLSATGTPPTHRLLVPNSV